MPMFSCRSVAFRLSLFACGVHLSQAGPPDASSSGSSSSAPWFEYSYERDFVESLVLVVLVVIAMLFEVFWHEVSHSVQDSYVYGHEHEQVYKDEAATDSRHHGAQHLNLHQELVSRTGGEFMTLGVLAFLIFALNNWFDLFGWLAVKVEAPQGFHFPSTAYDWLHMAEAVHVQLFIGMCIYFVLVLKIVRGSTQKIHHMEKLRLQRLWIGGEHEELATHSCKVSDMKEYNMLRRYLVEKIMQWSRKDKKLFAQVQQELQIDMSSPDANSQLREQVDSRFSLAAYLALNIEHGVRDMIQVHASSWVGVIIIFLICLPSCWAGAQLVYLLPSAVAVVAIMLVVMMCIGRRRMHRMEDFLRNHQGDVDLWAESPTSNEYQPSSVWRLPLGLWFVRVLQVQLFAFSYIFARTLVDVHEWNLHFSWTLAENLAYMSIFCGLLSFLPRQVPSFLELMAFPPYVDNQNLLAFFKAMKDDKVHVTKVQGQQKLDKAQTPNLDAGQLAAVWELADLLGKRQDLEDRLNLCSAHRSDDLVSASAPTCSPHHLPTPPTSSHADSDGTSTATDARRLLGV